MRKNIFGQIFIEEIEKEVTDSDKIKYKIK